MSQFNLNNMPNFPWSFPFVRTSVLASARCTYDAQKKLVGYISNAHWEYGEGACRYVAMRHKEIECIGMTGRSRNISFGPETIHNLPEVAMRLRGTSTDVTARTIITRVSLAQNFFKRPARFSVRFLMDNRSQSFVNPYEMQVFVMMADKWAATALEYLARVYRRDLQRACADTGQSAEDDSLTIQQSFKYIGVDTQRDDIGVLYERLKSGRSTSKIIEEGICAASVDDFNRLLIIANPDHRPTTLDIAWCSSIQAIISREREQHTHVTVGFTPKQTPYEDLLLWDGRWQYDPTPYHGTGIVRSSALQNAARHWWEHVYTLKK